MRNKILSILALGTALVGCECAPECVATDAVTPGSAADFKKNVPDRVFFAFNKSNINAEGQHTLSAQSGWLKTYPNTSVTIEGHCDVRGTEDYNLALGERRAKAAEHGLHKLGIANSRLHVISFGKNRPFATGNTEADHAQNRVAVTVVN